MNRNLFSGTYSISYTKYSKAFVHSFGFCELSSDKSIGNVASHEIHGFNLNPFNGHYKLFDQNYVV